MTAQDIREFNAYLHGCTDIQIEGVFEKEHEAGRDEYVALVEAEAARRGMILEGWTNDNGPGHEGPHSDGYMEE